MMMGYVVNNHCCFDCFDYMFAETSAKWLITRFLAHAFQRRKWRTLLQFARHRRLALTIRDEIADVSCDLFC